MKDKMNLLKLLSNPGKLQGMMEKAQEELAKKEAKGEAGGGAVIVTMNGKHMITNIEISDEILTESKDILQDLIIAAVNDATLKVADFTKDLMMGSGGLGGLGL